MTRLKLPYNISVIFDSVGTYVGNDKGEIVVADDRVKFCLTQGCTPVPVDPVPPAPAVDPVDPAA